jgi:hypothetical protein
MVCVLRRTPAWADCRRPRAARAMTKVRLKYLHCFTDRHGKPHCYFRYRGQQWPLPAPGTEGFASAYDALLAHIRANPFAIRHNVEFMPGSLARAIEKFLVSPLYNEHAEPTKRNYRQLTGQTRMPERPCENEAGVRMPRAWRLHEPTDEKQADSVIECSNKPSSPGSSRPYHRGQRSRATSARSSRRRLRIASGVRLLLNSSSSALRVPMGVDLSVSPMPSYPIPMSVRRSPRPSSRIRVPRPPNAILGTTIP